MKDSKRDLFEILKERSLNLSSLFNAIECAEGDLNKIKKLAIRRGSGDSVEIKEMTTLVISAKKHLDEALVFTIESLLEKKQ